ncbi:MAG: hypothetical protein HY556_05005 [Euryarchaeota archaeon]|nr:hypothetical protein [Euryarchaeota archaeon]
MKKETVKDADYGEIELPAPPRQADFDRVSRDIREKLEATRLWPIGSVTACPKCDRKSFVGREDLSYLVSRPGRVLVFRHLQGARCTACGTECLEPKEWVAIEGEAGLPMLADYEAKVSRIGSGTLGTYWPRDVVRLLELDPSLKAFIQVLDKRTALVRFGEPGNEGKPKRKVKAGT